MIFGSSKNPKEVIVSRKIYLYKFLLKKCTYKSEKFGNSKKQRISKQVMVHM